MKALLLLVLGYSALPIRDQEEVPVRYMRPSLLVAKLAPMLQDLGGVEADDFKGVLRISGTEEDILKVKRFIAMFDVKPHKLTLKWTLKSEIDKYESQGQVTTGNNGQFGFTLAELGTKVTLQPRLIVEKDRDIVSFRTTVRMEVSSAVFTKDVESKSGLQVILKVPEMIPMGERATKAVNSVDKRLWPELLLTVSFGGS